MAKRVIGSEHMSQARAQGRNSMEVLPDDIVTSEARDSAACLGINCWMARLKNRQL